VGFPFPSPAELFNQLKYDCQKTENIDVTIDRDWGLIYEKLNAVTKGQYKKLLGILMDAVFFTLSITPQSPSPARRP
jgi:hypothetical protein